MSASVFTVYPSTKQQQRNTQNTGYVCLSVCLSLAALHSVCLCLFICLLECQPMSTCPLVCLSALVFKTSSSRSDCIKSEKPQEAASPHTYPVLWRGCWPNVQSRLITSFARNARSIRFPLYEFSPQRPRPRALGINSDTGAVAFRATRVPSVSPNSGPAWLHTQPGWGSDVPTRPLRLKRKCKLAWLPIQPSHLRQIRNQSSGDPGQESANCVFLFLLQEAAVLPSQEMNSSENMDT